MLKLSSSERGASVRGFSLVELVIVVAIVGILASAAMPLARWSVKRGKEHELQQNLRILRNAIDRYHDAARAGLIEVPEGESGFPPSLDLLVEGVPLIAPIPVPVPPVGGEYDATGAGLTGGLTGLAQQAQSGQGGLGGSGGFGGQAAGADSGAATSGFGSVSAGATAARGGGRRSLFDRSSTGQGAAGGATAGSRVGGGSASGSRFGGSSAGTTGQQGGQGASGGRQGSLLDRGPTLLGGGTANVQQPIVGHDGQVVKLILLRRLPVDPFTGKTDWGMRCYGEPPEDRMWCGKDVFDVYSKSVAKAIDGTSYRDW